MSVLGKKMKKAANGPGGGIGGFVNARIYRRNSPQQALDLPVNPYLSYP